jgi:hypothetical protein
MAKFKGFNLDQKFQLLQKLGYNGPKNEDLMEKFLAASPEASSKMSRYFDKAQEAIKMASGGQVPSPNDINVKQAQNQLNKAQQNLATAEAFAKNNPNNQEAAAALKKAQNQFANKQKQFSLVAVPSAGEAFSGAIETPQNLVAQAKAVNVQKNDGQFVNQNTGSVTGQVKADTSTVQNAAQAKAPKQPKTSTYKSQGITGQVTQAAQNLKAAEGDVTGKVQGQTADPSKLGQLKLDAAQIEDPTTIKNTPDLKATPGQMVQGAKLKPGEVPTSKAAQTNFKSNPVAAQGQVNKNELIGADKILAGEKAVTAKAATDSKLSKEATAVAAQGKLGDKALAEAAQGKVQDRATVQGQLEKLMESFNDGTPAWAAGAMRAATQAMNARGLGGSSMAAAAIVQAAMESAIPIAAADAQVFERMQLKNLDNRQQTALANAAAQQGMSLANLNAKQQAALQNSAQGFQLQSQNLSNEQAVVLANAQFKAALQNKTIDVKTQAAIVNAARYAESNNINLSNRQQANLQRSAENLQVDLSNLSNRQQTALANAQIEAALKGQELSNEQQARVLNAARISEVANINFTAEQQKALEEAKIAATVDLANLDAKSAKVLADAAAMSTMELTNLNNRQQAQVENAKNLLQMDLANLNTDQQTRVLKFQSRVNSMLSDQAADNAAKQFNAASENQVNQFFAGLQESISRFNADQVNAIKKFNSGEKNATSQFNATMKSARETFNAANRAVIAQANAKWRQDVAKTNALQQTEVNLENAKSLTGLTQKGLDNLWMRERDLLSYAFQTSENAQERALKLLLTDKNIGADERARADENNAYLWAVITKSAGELLKGIF